MNRNDRRELLRDIHRLAANDPALNATLGHTATTKSARGANVPDRRTAEKMMRKWMDHASQPEKELIDFTEAMEDAGHDELVEILDEAITHFSQARGALDRTRIRLSKYLS